MDATCLNVPSDFERLPEFRFLCAELSARATKMAGTGKKTIEAVATFLFMRLWVELGLLAQSTNRPGYLTSEGKKLFESTVDEFFGEDIYPAELLARAGILQVLPARGDTAKEYFSERFARLNAHTAGNFVRREVKGAHASALVRRGGEIMKAAAAQVMLLGPEIFKKRDGSAMADSEINRAMVLIKTLESCLGVRPKQRSEYTEGLMADACAVIEKHKPEELRPFYEWLMSHKTQAGLPKTPEGILSEWPMVCAMCGEVTG